MMNPNETYLQLVLTKLEEAIGRLNASISRGEQEIQAMNEYYWDNYTEMDEYGYENYDNQKALFGQMTVTNSQLDLKHRYQKMLYSPYFGRVDFRFEDEEEAESFHIGIGNFSEAPGMTPLIYDWRAPISSLFYDYDRGPASFEAPAGLISGDITSKWQYKIRRGKMIYAFESDVKIDDEILKAELGKNGDVHLKNIVRTIQREQNAIIRNTKDRILIVQGCAGSGKTSVALHRIAYLLYHDRKRLTSDSVVILSPNAVFTDYISRILPELGEQNIQEMSFDLFAYRQLKSFINDCEDRYDEMERQLSGAGSPHYAYKQSKEFAEKIRGFVLSLEDDLMDFKDFTFRKWTVPAEELEKYFYFKFTGTPLLDRMGAVMDYEVDAEETLRGREFTEEEKIVITEKMMKMYETRDIYILYSRFLKSQGLPELPHLPVQERILPYEDVYPILYMKYLLEAPKGLKAVRHLVIDEMQDYSYIQYLLLDRLFSCPMTILGDLAQTMDEKEQDVTRFLPKILGKDSRVLYLNKSYRSTVEITKMAEKIRGKEGGEAISRHGKEPEEIKAASFEEAVSQALARVKTTGSGEQESGKWPHAEVTEPPYVPAAVLCMTEKEAREAYEIARQTAIRCGADPDKLVYLLDKNSRQFKDGLVVTTFYLAKGLEFDQVFTIYHKDEDGPLFTHARYICATRALHELYMVEMS